MRAPSPKIYVPPSSALLAAIVDSSDDAIVSKDLSGTITSWNKGAERIFGYAADEAIGRPITMIVPADRTDEEPKILERLRRGERIEHFETVRQAKDGTQRDISLTISPVRDATGKIVGASKIARDITERRRAREELQRSEEQFRVTLASIGDAVIATDKEGRITFMNPVAEQLTGWTGAEAVGEPLTAVFKIVNELTRATVENPAAKVLRLGHVVGLANHTSLIAKDGGESPIDDSGAPIRDANGQLTGVVLVFRDVTERRRAELMAERLAAIVEGSILAIVSENFQGIVTSWNEGAQHVFGYSADEMVGHPAARLVPPGREDEEAPARKRVQRGEHVETLETLRLHKDGRSRWVRLSLSPLKNTAGQIVGVAKIARDVTQQKEAELALHEAQKQLGLRALDLETKVRERTAKLQESVGELEAFSYSLSHDMRAPLRAIQSFTEIVLADNGERIGTTGAGYLKRVISAAQRMERLIQDVLAYSRVSRRTIGFEPIDVEKLIEGIINERPEFQPPAAEIVIQRPLLPLVAHVVSLTQCLTNLLENAVKFVARGVKPRVSISTELIGSQVRLWVEDNGIGIAPDAQRRLFAMFQRLHTEREYAGTGIGLVIVRKAAERMGGQVGVESEPGKGSRFWLQLPGTRL